MKNYIILTGIIVAIAIIGFYLMFQNQNSADNVDSSEEEENSQNQQQSSENEDNGLKIEILQEASGQEAKSGDRVTVHYVGTLTDGSQFDSSVGQIPFVFELGAGKVIKGWDIGVLGMKVGEKRKLTIPPELGYGSIDLGTIPPNSTLIFEVELISIAESVQ